MKVKGARTQAKVRRLALSLKVTERDLEWDAGTSKKTRITASTSAPMGADCSPRQEKARLDVYWMRGLKLMAAAGLTLW